MDEKRYNQYTVYDPLTEREVAFTLEKDREKVYLSATPDSDPETLNNIINPLNIELDEATSGKLGIDIPSPFKGPLYLNYEAMSAKGLFSALDNCLTGAMEAAQAIKHLTPSPATPSAASAAQTGSMNLPDAGNIIMDCFNSICRNLNLTPTGNTPHLGANNQKPVAGLKANLHAGYSLKEVAQYLNRAASEFNRTSQGVTMRAAVNMEAASLEIIVTANQRSMLPRDFAERVATKLPGALEAAGKIPQRISLRDVHASERANTKPYLN